MFYYTLGEDLGAVLPSLCCIVLQGNLVAVGTHKGFVQIWDAAAGKKLSVLEGHTARVGEYWEQEYQDCLHLASYRSQLSCLQRKAMFNSDLICRLCVLCRGTGLECGPAVVRQP